MTSRAAVQVRMVNDASQLQFTLQPGSNVNQRSLFLGNSDGMKTLGFCAMAVLSGLQYE